MSEGMFPSEEQYGWKNVAKGTICQTVVAESPKALYEKAGLGDEMPQDPLKMEYKGFTVVPVNVQTATFKEGRKKATTKMIVTEQIAPKILIIKEEDKDKLPTDLTGILDKRAMPKKLDPTKTIPIHFSDEDKEKIRTLKDRLEKKRNK